MLIGWSWVSKSATVTLSIDSSSDGSTWTNRLTTTGITTVSQPAFYKFTSFGTNPYLRITITKTDTATDTTKNISSIKLLTSKWGAQGAGSEYEKPYNADENRHIMPWVNNSQKLGSSSYKWASVYATTFYGALSGNASTATNSSKINVANYDSTTFYPCGPSSTTTGSTALGRSSKFYITSDGAYHTSDANKKKNITDIPTSDVEKFFSTENGYIREYDWKDNDHHAVGVIAQEIEEFIPEAVNEDKDGTKSVNYNVALSKMIGCMFRKIKEMETVIQQQEEEIEKLKLNNQ